MSAQFLTINISVKVFYVAIKIVSDDCCFQAQYSKELVHNAAWMTIFSKIRIENIEITKYILTANQSDLF